MLLEHPFTLDSRVLKEARSLTNAGYRVTVVARSGSGQPKRETRSGFEILRPRRPVGRINTKLLYPLAALEFFVVTFLAAFFRRTDVYHCHSPALLLQAVLAGTLRRKPVIYDAHELSAALTRKRSLRSMFPRVAEKISLWRVKRVIMSDGESRANAFRQIHGYRGPIDYVYNCAVTVDTSTADHNLRARLGVPKTGDVVLYVGVVDRERGLESAIRAMGSCDRAINLVLMGPVNESYRPGIVRLARQTGVLERLHFLDSVPTDDVPLWAASADMSLTLIQPFSLSYELSAPTKMFEALMAGIPQVASDFPEMRRVLLDNGVGPAGVLVDPQDDDAVARAICGLLEDKERMSVLAANAIELARRDYNWENQEKTLTRLYEEVLQGADR